MHIFVDGLNSEFVEIRGEDAFHIAVTRKRILQQKIKLISISGTEWADGEAVEVSNKKVRVKVLARYKKPAVQLPEIWLYQAMIKKNKMEIVLQKAVELGIKNIVPVLAERCVVDAARTKEDRWNSILKEAAMQSEAYHLPKLHEPIKLDKIKESEGLFLEARREYPGLLSALKEWKKPQKMAVFIGPEGGFTDKEVEFLEASGLVGASLGPSILRAETAAIASVAVINACYL